MDLIPIKDLQRPKYIQLNYNKLMLGIEMNVSSSSGDGRLSIFKSRIDGGYLFVKKLYN
jgi:hypothetical protein